MIMHLDLDAFFASAERINNPSLEGVPIAVGGRSDPFIFDNKSRSQALSMKNSGAFVPALFHREISENFESYFKEKEKIRGIVITSSYEARAFGIKTGMSLAEALRRCPHLIIRVPDHTLYHQLSHDLKQFLAKRVPLLEQYSIDEFFADISGWIKEEEIEAFAENLRQEIAKELSLPISIGIAPSKWIAKLCTNFAKPKGIKYIQQKDLDAFIFDIPIEAFAGIGRATQAKLHKYHKQTLGDIQASKTLLYSWGNSGKVLYDRVCGLDKDKVIHKRDRKSIGISRTFDAIKNRSELHRRVHILARHLLFLLNKQTLHPQTLHFGIRYTHASSKKQIPLEGILSEQFLYQTTIMIFKQLDIYPQSEVIRLTLSFSNFQDKAIQSRSLFAYHDERKAHELSLKTQNLREKYGIDILKWGSEL